jgi:predicted RNase H-like HicB family nuclease
MLTMAYYLAILYEDPGASVGVSIPDLPGCYSAGDDIGDAIRNAAEAIELYLETLLDDNLPLPRARSAEELRRDPETASEMAGNQIAVIQYKTPILATAAE